MKNFDRSPVSLVELAKLYDDAHDSCSAALAAGVLPRDIEHTWPNVLGFMRRIPGQRYHRAPPNGIEDPPTEREISVFATALKIHKRRADQAMAKVRP